MAEEHDLAEQPPSASDTPGTISITPHASHQVDKPKYSETEKVNLKLILVSGRTQEFQFPLGTSASDIGNYVFANWPKDWEEEKVESASVLKLIYHGRFLHGNVTLGALSLPVGKTTVMHLVARENLPEPNSQDNLKKTKRRCCQCCGII